MMANSDRRQVPGYFRQAVGGCVVTAIYDGYINLSPSLFHGVDDDTMQTLIGKKHKMRISEDIPTSVTTYLIDNGRSKTLLNVGGAGGTMGNILENLRASGCSPADIQSVLLTHMHFDHVCGLVNEDGAAVFSNATVYASEGESRFWLDPQNAKSAPEAAKAFFEMAVNSIQPYKDRGRFKTFSGHVEVLPGIEAFPSPGHTPGHTSYLVGDGHERLLLWGDIVHSHALQFSHPEVTNDFDADQPQAAATRASIFQKAAADNLLIGGDHLPFPGFGYMQKDSQGYAWVPVEYAALDM